MLRPLHDQYAAPVAIRAVVVVTLPEMIKRLGDWRRINVKSNAGAKR